MYSVYIHNHADSVLYTSTPPTLTPSLHIWAAGVSKVVFPAPPPAPASYYHEISSCQTIVCSSLTFILPFAVQYSTVTVTLTTTVLLEKLVVPEPIDP